MNTKKKQAQKKPRDKKQFLPSCQTIAPLGFHPGNSTFWLFIFPRLEQPPPPIPTPPPPHCQTPRGRKPNLSLGAAALARMWALPWSAHFEGSMASSGEPVRRSHMIPTILAPGHPQGPNGKTPRFDPRTKLILTHPRTHPRPDSGPDLGPGAPPPHSLVAKPSQPQTKPTAMSRGWGDMLIKMAMIKKGTVSMQQPRRLQKGVGEPIIRCQITPREVSDPRAPLHASCSPKDPQAP